MPSGPLCIGRKTLAGRCSHANSPDVRETAGASYVLAASVTSGRRCASIILLRARNDVPVNVAAVRLMPASIGVKAR